MKLTPWIPGHIKPTRVGVYERDYGDGSAVYCKWDGLIWYFYGKTKKSAWAEICKSAEQSLPWRGLALDPNKRKRK